MKHTGPTKDSTRKLVVELEKHGKKKKKKFWIVLSKALAKSSRSRPKVNLWKLSKLEKKSPGKILVIPGTVLSTGEIEGKIEVAAFRFSGKAKEKISKTGKAMSLKELISKDISAGKLVIIK